MKNFIFIAIGLLFCMCALGQERKGKEYFLIDTLLYDSLAPDDKALIDSLLPLYHRAKADTTRMRIISDLSAGLLDEMLWSQYNRILHKKTEELLKLPKTNSEPELKLIKKYFAASLQNFGYYAQTVRSDQAQAVRFYTECLRIQREIADQSGIATTLNNMANNFAYQGNVAKALEYYFESLKIRELLKDKGGMAASYNNLASSYMAQQDTAKALEYLHKCISILLETKNTYGLAYALNNLGSIYSKKRDYAKARDYFQKGLDAWNTLHSDEGKPFAMQNLGTVIQKQSDMLPPSAERDSLHWLAISYMNQGLKILKEKNDIQGIARMQTALGNAYLSSGDLTKALDYGVSSLKNAQKAGFPPFISDAAELLYKIYRKKDQLKNALSMHELFIQMRDSIFNQETQKTSFKQMMKYDYEKQQVLKDAGHQKEMAIAEEGKKRQQVISYAIGLGLLMVALFAIFIFNRLQITRKQKLIIEDQKIIVDQKNKHITDSINYAKRIQDSILPSKEDLSKRFSDYFVFFQPKDIVSGDFYWLSHLSGNKTILAVADCTGHGVPGAFMSMIGNTLLNEIVNEQKIIEPAEILNHLNEGIVHALHQESRTQDDGMDITLCLFDHDTNTLTFAGANHSLYVTNEGVLKKIEGDYFSIGSVFGKKQAAFTQKEIPLQKNTSVFLSSDGYPDQPGGEKGKKFMTKKFEELLLSISALSIKEQEQILKKTFEDWKNTKQQVDDVLVFGIKV